MALFQRDKSGEKLDFAGIDLVHPVDRMAPNKSPFAQNIRRYLKGVIIGRNRLSNAILTLLAPVRTVARLNDTIPGGPAAGYAYITADSGGNVYAASSGTPAPVATGLSTNPVSIVTFRPNTSARPFAYIGDSAPSPNVTVTGGFNCSGMIKVRADGLARKTGIAEPQIAPTTSFPGGGSGPSLIYYYYVYRASETGAISNPSPVSIPGTNSQSSPSVSVSATSYATNYTFNAAQYEFVGSQIRTKGGVPPGTITDFVVMKTGSTPFAVPSGVQIDGIQIDLNWVGQNSGTGTLSSVALYYLGQQLGAPKFPGIQNTSYSSDTFQGGSSDKWGATLTPAIINDPSFGFGVQITTQNSGGSDRSFINYMAVTVYYSTQNANITVTASPDPQVDKIDIYRQGGGLANPTYVGTTTNSAATFTDTLSDLAVANNPLMEFDNFEPFPSIDLPRSGVLNASGGILTWVSGDLFNPRWLGGTIILIGSPTQTAYTAVRRPTSTTSWNFINNDPTVTPIPDGTNLVWNIAEPKLAAQPLPYLFGPTDNVNFQFGVGDPLRPDVFYWCKGANMDSAPDTNQQSVTGSPSEPLVNGAMSNGLGVVFSIKRGWIIAPNYFNAQATAIGTTGSTWSLSATTIPRGLYMPRCVAVEGGGLIFFRVDDGIHVGNAGGGSKSITDDDLYPLFPHENLDGGTSVPVPITIAGNTIYPPDDSQPQYQQFSIQNGYMYYDYRSSDNIQRTLVFDIAAMGWVWDVYATPVICRGQNEALSTQGILCGCTDNTVRLMTSDGTELADAVWLTPAWDKGDTRANAQWADCYIEKEGT